MNWSHKMRRRVVDVLIDKDGNASYKIGLKTPMYKQMKTVFDWSWTLGMTNMTLRSQIIDKDCVHWPTFESLTHCYTMYNIRRVDTNLHYTAPSYLFSHQLSCLFRLLTCWSMSRSTSRSQSMRYWLLRRRQSSWRHTTLKRIRS